MTTRCENTVTCDANPSALRRKRQGILSITLTATQNDDLTCPNKFDIVLGVQAKRTLHCTMAHLASSDKSPTYVYKLIPHDAPPPLPPTPLPDALPVSLLDQTSGFIHLSTAPQLLGTLIHFFTNDPKVYVLKLPYNALNDQIRWENPKGEVCGDRGGEGMFPHLYNGLRLGKAEAESVVCWQREDGGKSLRSWEEVVRDATLDGWMVY